MHVTEYPIRGKLWAENKEEKKMKAKISILCSSCSGLKKLKSHPNWATYL